MTLRHFALFVILMTVWAFVTAMASANLEAYGVKSAVTEGKYWFGIGMGVLIARFIIWPGKWR